jgi:serine/threonine protein kinase
LLFATLRAGVCRLLGTCEKNGRLCLVLKRYECNLASKIAAGLEPRELRRIAHSLFQTLQQLHAVGVVVKDIKPENVLIDQAGRPTLASLSW